MFIKIPKTMDGKKEYRIEINGVAQSISQVDALMEALKNLDNKLKELESRNINVSSTQIGNRNADLETESKVLKEIEKTEAQIAKVRSEDYQYLLQQKDAMKEASEAAKERAAAERLASNSYANTMKGVKQELSDIKKVMQNTEIGSEAFKNLTKRAGELTSKLKDLETAYGQFGRNVGNYASAAEGFSKFTVKVGDSVREFNSARDAARQLRQELLSLDENADGIDDLKKAINSVDSAIKDATVSSKAMDEALDMAQSLIGIAQAGQGFSAFFGFDNSEIEETIKNLVALQSALNGIEMLSKQLNAEEGIFKYFKSANDAIDNFTKKIFGVKTTLKETVKATKEQAEATASVANASKQATNAEVAQGTATAALTIGMRVATVAARVLSVALKAIGIGFVLEGLSYALEGIKKLGSAIYSAFHTAEQQVEVLNMEFNALKQSYSYLIEENNRLYDQGHLSYLEYISNQLKIQNDYIAKQIELQKELDELNGDDKKIHWYTIAGDQTTNFGDKIGQNTTFSTTDLISSFYMTVNNLEEAKKAYEELNNAVRKGNDYFTEYGKGLSDWVNSLTITVSDTKDLMYNVAEGILNDFLARIAEAHSEYAQAMEDVKNGVAGAGDRLEKAKKKVKDLVDEMNDDRVMSSVIANLDNFIPDEAAREKINNIIGALKSLKQEMEAKESDVRNYFENLAIEMLPEYERAMAKIEQKRQEDLRQYGLDEEKRAKINAYYDKEIQDETDKHNNKMKSKRSTANKDALDAEKTLQQLRLRVMEDGLNKKMMQLDEEKRQTLNKLKNNQEAYLQAERLYEQIRLREIQQFTENLERAIEASARNIRQTTFQLNLDVIQTQIGEIDRLLSDANKLYAPYFKTLVSSDEYRELTEGTTEESLRQANLELGILDLYSDKEIEILEQKYKKEFQLIRSYGIQSENALLSSFEERIAAQRYYLDELFKITKNELSDRKDLLKEAALEEQKQANESAKQERKQRLDELKQRRQELEESISVFSSLTTEMTEEQRDSYERLQDDLTNVLQQIETANENYAIQINLNKQKYDQKLIEIDEKTAEEMSRIHERYFNAQIRNFRDFNSKLSREVSKQPIYDSLGFGIINIAKTKKNYQEMQDAAISSLNNINEERQMLSDSYSDGLISTESYNAILLQLDDLASTATDTIKEVSGLLSRVGEEFVASIQPLFQTLANTIGQVLSSLSEITSNHYDKEIEQQEKYIDKLQEMYDEQREITQKYADEVNSIEDALATARGDRRDHLIDKLNAEMEAQRASLAQQKKIEKEQEKADQKKMKLEHDQAVARKKMDLAQAYINAAMAVSMAAVNRYPIPAIPMMALASAVGAAQIAAVASRNIPSYGSGGVIQGKSHSQGGVKVLGGRAEVEGGEYITNKVTTSKNVDLLEFINTKRKRINLEDLVEFYGGNGKVSKNIQTVRTKFADGGVVPTLRTDISINDRLLTAFEDYSKRPTLVSVVDIIDKTKTVNDVMVMAGIEPNY